tara:strand:+ start:438 stop:635 length:198 start_codon:yes stop_codon:yes gene_type:complete
MFSLLRGIEFGLLSSKFLVCAFIEISDKQKRMEETYLKVFIYIANQYFIPILNLTISFQKITLTS